MPYGMIAITRINSILLRNANIVIQILTFFFSAFLMFTEFKVTSVLHAVMDQLKCAID